MPLFIVLLVLGVILICAAYYLQGMPPEISGLCKFGGVACMIIGMVWAVWVLLLSGAIGAT